MPKVFPFDCPDLNCNYKSRGDEQQDAYHKAEHALLDDMGSEPNEVDWFDAGWNARDTRIAALERELATAKAVLGAWDGKDTDYTHFAHCSVGVDGGCHRCRLQDELATERRRREGAEAAHYSKTDEGEIICAHCECSRVSGHDDAIIGGPCPVFLHEQEHDDE